VVTRPHSLLYTLAASSYCLAAGMRRHATEIMTRKVDGSISGPFIIRLARPVQLKEYSEVLDSPQLLTERRLMLSSTPQIQ